MNGRVEVTKRCPKGHETRHAVTKPGSVHCRTCGVSVWISRGDLETARAATAPGGKAVEGEAARLTRLWAAERDAEAGQPGSAGMLGDQAGDLGCGHPGRWTTDHTAIVCEQCKTHSTSPGSKALADAFAAQRASRRGEIAPRITGAEARRARVELHAARKQAEKYLGKLLDDITRAGDLAEAEGNAYLADRAEGLYDLAEGYAKEIADADSLNLLGELLGELRTVRDGGDFGQLMTLVYQAEHRRQREAQQAEQRRREAEQRKQLARAQARQRQQLSAGHPPVTTDGYALLINYFDKMIRDRKERRERNGECGWCKRIAERVYGAGVHDSFGNLMPYQHLPQARACNRHFSAAARWIMSQCGQGHWEMCYWELT